MDDARIGAAFRAVRLRARQRQVDVARSSVVARSTVIDVERGRLERARVSDLRSMGAALGIRVDVSANWNGAGLDQWLDAGHAQMHEALAGMFRTLPQWMDVPEVSFSIFGERGVLDIAAWQASTNSLLLVEIKTALGDPQLLMSTMDRRVRLASQIVADRGWRPRTVSVWIVFVDTRTNRRHVTSHRGLLRSRTTADGRAMRAWLRAPKGTIWALSTWSDVRAGDLVRRSATLRRVRPTTAERAEHADPGTS